MAVWRGVVVVVGSGLGMGLEEAGEGQRPKPAMCGAASLHAHAFCYLYVPISCAAEAACPLLPLPAVLRQPASISHLWAAAAGRGRSAAPDAPRRRARGGGEEALHPGKGAEPAPWVG